MYVKVQGSQAAQPATVIRMRCPACRQRGILEALNGQDTVVGAGQTAGYRRCPDPACNVLLFFVVGPQGLISYPAERIDFDATNVPPPVLAALTEAVTCHADECFIAAAIMVRKTLEELCRDRKAEGANLKERIKALGAKVVLPAELLDGLDDLRLLGNDAAHIESRQYDKVGNEEVAVGIEFAKEVLKAVYQYSALLAKLRAMKKPSPPAP
jgi:Domain of unknown function (DUF4145)